MSITSMVINKLNGVFNLLGVTVTLKKPVQTTDSYGTKRTDSYEESSLVCLPHIENFDIKELREMGDTNNGRVYFAVKHTENVATGDVISYINKDYEVTRIQEYSWGGVVMKSLETVVVGH